MPLTNRVILKLNEITTLIEDKNNIKDSEIEEIKKIFTELLDSGERLDLDDVESWFEYEGSWKNKESKTRVINLAHYIQNKFQQTFKLNILSEDSCGCGN